MEERMMNTMKKQTRVLAILMALLMAVSVLGVSASAGEYTETNTYVLNYNGVYEGPRWQYFSPYWPAFALDGEADYTQSLSFTLYNTLNGTFSMFALMRSRLASEA